MNAIKYESIDSHFQNSTNVGNSLSENVEVEERAAEEWNT
jgi:hypothetical protein